MSLDRRGFESSFIWHTMAPVRSSDPGDTAGGRCESTLQGSTGDAIRTQKKVVR